MKFLKFQVNNCDSTTVETYTETPKDMDIFYRTEDQFLPEGKDWDDLTKEELKIARNRYRFDYLKPGYYQAISGIGTKGQT